jgi:hypothetical protein
MDTRWTLTFSLFRRYNCCYCNAITYNRYGQSVSRFLYSFTAIKSKHRRQTLKKCIFFCSLLKTSNSIYVELGRTFRHISFGPPADFLFCHRVSNVVPVKGCIYIIMVIYILCYPKRYNSVQHRSIVLLDNPCVRTGRWIIRILGRLKVYLSGCVSRYGNLMLYWIWLGPIFAFVRILRLYGTIRERVYVETQFLTR